MHQSGRNGQLNPFMVGFNDYHKGFFYATKGVNIFKQNKTDIT